MALIKWPECGKEISDQAKTCPNCGYPLENIDIIEKSDKEECTPEEKYFTVCYQCGNFTFTNKLRIDNTIKSCGHPTCMWCGGEIKILAGKNAWMNKPRREREDIVEEETQRIKSSPKYDIQLAQKYERGNGLRPDLDVIGYCPKCASYYPRSKALKENITNCEHCGTTIEYSNMLSSDFTEMFNAEMEKLGIKPLQNAEPIEKFIHKTFLLDNKQFDEIAFDKKWHPENYEDAPKSNKELNVNVPKCPTCQSTDIKKISTTSKAGSVFLWGLFSQKVKRQWHCNNCGYEW